MNSMKSSSSIFNAISPHRLEADGYQPTASGYRFPTDFYQLATDHLYDDAPDFLQT
jgi:hypothetical protein